jgi:RNA polymerase sigma-70 factor (ECF subfamily)
VRFASLFAAVYEGCYGAIHAYAYAYASRRVGVQPADEVAAETFLVAWRKFDALPSDPLPWLYGVARNVVARHHEGNRRQRQAHALLERERRPSDPGQEGDDPRLWEAWAQLSASDREVLALVAWEELSVADAARAFGCTVPVFSVRLHRARRRLQRLLVQDQSLSSVKPVEA